MTELSIQGQHRANTVYYVFVGNEKVASARQKSVKVWFYFILLVISVKLCRRFLFISARLPKIIYSFTPHTASKELRLLF